MHLYNAWLPPSVAEETKREAESFTAAVRSVRCLWRPDDADSVYATLKWISVLELFIKAKSEVSLVDVKKLVEFGFELFYVSQDKLYAQVRWGSFLVKLLRKYGKKLALTVPWRPLYETLMCTHFKRSTGPEGWRLRQRHFETVTSLVRSCRKFFPAGSASEIWSEFRALMENPWHNSSFEGSGFIRLFLPMNSENHDYFTSDWIKECLGLWDLVPNCQFWDIQWAFVFARCIKNCKSIDWEPFLPILFSRYLNMFEVPVSNANGSYPFPLEVHRNTRFLFSSKMGSPAKAIAKSIVQLLKPGSLAQENFERLANLLEQYYHPSNGGRWSYSLERFLRHLVIAFQKRLQQEQVATDANRQPEFRLGKLERSSFVRTVLKLIDRGQYSKNDSLAETVAVATSMLAYVEPTLVLPFIASRFHLALETMTATHQLKSAVTSVAFAGRALLLASVSEPIQTDDLGATDISMDLLRISLSNALFGMDANDPPKTLATMQLISSIFSNLAKVGASEEGPAFLQSFSFSEWLDEFFCNLFSLLQHLEPSSVINEGIQTSVTSGTFLVEDSPYYFCMLEILLGKLSKPLLNQSLRKISKFISRSVLPGATAEVGLLCCACVCSNPEEAAAHLIKPILMSINSSLKGTPVTGFGGRGASEVSFSRKSTLSPALETSVEYHLKILAIAISYGGPALIQYKDELKEAIASAFQAPSWKVNGAGDHVLRSLLGSLVLYYPIDQYRPFTFQPGASVLEEWGCSKSKDNVKNEQANLLPKWHIPAPEELFFANELLDLHLVSALDDLLRICQNKIHTDTGDEKEHLKVTLLRIYSSLQGVMSCLPDMRPTCKNKGERDLDGSYFFIAGAVGSSVGSSELREKAAEDIHVACKYLLKERSDDSVLLMLIIRIMDALGNFGNLEYEEWSNHIQAWKLESAAIIEPPCNFIISSHAPGKRRPRWALIDKAYMHNLWRCSQQAYHKFRTDSSLSPSGHVIILMDDLLDLSLHNYETVRSLAGRSLSMMLKRWPSLTANCVLRFTGNLCDPKSPEHVILGSCAILASQNVLRHLTTDAASFSSFVTGLLASSHHESLKAQKAITELFVKYNIHFSGISRSFFKSLDGQTNGSGFSNLISQISSLSFDTNGLHWRYNLMANRVLLLLTLSSRTHSNLPSNVIEETAAHFLRNLKSQLPQSRMLAISALNTLLQGAPHKNKSLGLEKNLSADNLQVNSNSSLGGILSQIYKEEGFFSETLNSLSHVHIISDTDSTSKGNHGSSSFQSLADKAITFFYFDFSASWPRTPSWISLLGGDTFYSNFARIFKRLAQECGTPILQELQSTLAEFSCAKERSKQCVAAEVLAGILHSDINGLLEAWDSWIVLYFQKIIGAPSVESIPEWAACIRYAVTGKGKNGTGVPLLRQRILDCLEKPLSQTLTTNVVTKRYAFLSVVLIEISPQRMPTEELEFHYRLMDELLDNLSHPSAQVREVIGITLSVLCSNLRLSATFGQTHSINYGDSRMVESPQRDDWATVLTDRASELAMNIQSMESLADMADENGSINMEAQADVRRMETLFHFIISSLKSGRSSYLLDIIVGLLYPVISLQETSSKDLTTLAKAAFELLKWRILSRPLLEKAVSVILSSANDPNWHTRFASLTYLRTFMYRHTFTLSNSEKQQIWKNIENLLVDSQVEVREHAAGVLASLMKGGDEWLSSDFRVRAYAVAQSIQNKRRQRNRGSGQPVASVHGAVLALAASVLSVPYDMPSWLPEHVTLLARFINEPSPVKSTVTKAVAEFRRTHADTWNLQKESFTEEQLEVLADTSSSSSYFA
ncbi:proteasome activator subunit 4 isoform X1 [Dioscorea cayenensis subsp. rotundata]|uniref:Proteasome activator subunit 4 isoform X1 n=1 Tax=Dioscorea cayennensis subsp. rotundata TaxID=55577 RepID=A0AB40AYB9_DIOCR|nr:proteasome activator subunit 4 isoform X1 [Dioscorea cayenensis subsp. rotundata]